MIDLNKKPKKKPTHHKHIHKTNPKINIFKWQQQNKNKNTTNCPHNKQKQQRNNYDNRTYFKDKL